MKKEIIIIIILVIAIFLSLLLFNKMTGNMILQEDQFSEIKDLHWAHMPLIYSIDSNCENLAGNIRKSLSIIENSTNKAVYFKEGSNPDINISCSQVENCYEKKEERIWFWVITTEAVCEHESGTAQITKMKGNKIANAKINLFVVPETKNNCSETEIHEILHIFNYEHSENNKSIMYPSKENDECNEKIDSEIANDLISKYKATS